MARSTPSAWKCVGINPAATRLVNVRQLSDSSQLAGRLSLPAVITGTDTNAGVYKPIGRTWNAGLNFTF